jgi:hypothetical protein
LPGLFHRLPRVQGRNQHSVGILQLGQFADHPPTIWSSSG